MRIFTFCIFMNRVDFICSTEKIKEYFHAGSQAGYCCDKVVRGTKG